MTVATLITANHPETYVQCSLSLDTLRTGFPTAIIEVYVNPDSVRIPEIRQRCEAIGAIFRVLPLSSTHHAFWIKSIIRDMAMAVELGLAPQARPLAIVDPDCIFWRDCEQFVFPEAWLAGAFVPDHWNHWSQSAYRARLHTSFLWVPDPARLFRAAEELLPFAGGDYCPFDPYRPVMVYDYGRPTFYDTLAILCHALPRDKVAVFGEEHLNCYDHLNSASFFHEMQERWDNDEQRAEFARIHKLAETDPKELRGLWRKTVAYYQQQAGELVKRFGESNWNDAQKEKVSGNSQG